MLRTPANLFFRTANVCGAGLLCLLLAACSRQEGQLTVKGSDTLLPFSQMLAEVYLNIEPEADVIVVGGGSGTGISALMDGTTHIAMSSRRLKTGERIKLVDKGIEAVETIVAYDALALVVNARNPVEKLTREEIEGIFTGTITNWKQVGGRDETIVAYSRESSSGTYEFFKEHVLENKNFKNDVLALAATGAVVQSVKQTSGAIGYIGLAYLGEQAEMKALAVSYDQGKTYVMPSVEAAKDKSYPVARPLYYYHDKANTERVAPFLDFALSDRGQKIVLDVGFVPIR